MRLIDADAIKEQIENVNCKDCNHYNFVRCRACWIDDALSYIDDAPTVGQWISVEDKLPDKCSNYLVYFGKGIGTTMKTAVWLPEKRIWKGAEAYSTLNGITHWMPLPEPPEEVAKAE